MSGIYITAKQKELWESKIAELEKANVFYQINASYINPNYISNSTELKIYKELLYQATVLPVEESWEDVNKKSDYGLSDKEFYPNGVIIKKQ